MSAELNATAAQREPAGLLVIGLGLQIADDAARTDIETMCRQDTLEGRTWWQTRPIEPDCRRFVDRAVHYLELRGLIERHPADASLVRIKTIVG